MRLEKIVLSTMVKSGSPQGRFPLRCDAPSRRKNCKKCRQQFVINNSKKIVTKAQKDLIDKLLLERISLRGIKRVLGLSWRWLQDYVNIKLAQVTRQIKVLDKPRGKLTIECDELWSFVNSKGNEYYIWLAYESEN